MLPASFPEGYAAHALNEHPSGKLAPARWMLPASFPEGYAERALAC